jgi:hypothetical protein
MKVQIDEYIATFDRLNFKKVKPILIHGIKLEFDKIHLIDGIRSQQVETVPQLIKIYLLT